MTYSQLYRKAKSELKSAGIDTFQYDSMCLIEHFFKLTRTDLIVSGEKSPEKNLEEKFLKALYKRSTGYPLQYILGIWTFMDIPLYVGEGVLVPRDDTEVLVREAIERIEKIENPKIIDLCSGSGAVAISIAMAYPNAEVIAVELSDIAFGYLEKNIRHNNCKNIKAIKGDMFELYREFSDREFDVLVSNPPYIKTDIIKTLSKEVQNEPILALDGGNDGMIFYNSIAENWISKVKSNGFIGVEIGEDLTDDIVRLFEQGRLKDISVYKDMSELDRAIFGTVQ